MTPLRMTVLGSGSVGLPIAASCARAGQSVTLLARGSADEAHAVLPACLPVFSSIMMIRIERRSPTHVNVNVQASAVRVGSLFGATPEGMRDAVARGQAGFLPIT